MTDDRGYSLVRTPGRCCQGSQHWFDPGSGWCLNGCGWRNDGQSSYRPKDVDRDHSPAAHTGDDSRLPYADD